MVAAEILSGLRAERAKAATIVAACDAALAAFDASLEAEATPVDTKPLAKQVRAYRRVATPRAAKPTAPAVGDSKVSRYADVIVKVLRHHSLAPHHSADRVVLNREIAKVCDVKVDSLVSGDVSNALSKLKAAGTIERTGTVWALVEKP